MVAVFLCVRYVALKVFSVFFFVGIGNRALRSISFRISLDCPRKKWKRLGIMQPF